jgi:hypothetical protein
MFKFNPETNQWDSWLMDQDITEFQGASDPLQALLNTELVIPASEVDQWYDANVLAFDEEPVILLDIDTESYLLLQSSTPYMYCDEEFIEFISE